MTGETGRNQPPKPECPSGSAACVFLVSSPSHEGARIERGVEPKESWQVNVESSIHKTKGRRAIPKDACRVVGLSQSSKSDREPQAGGAICGRPSRFEAPIQDERRPRQLQVSGGVCLVRDGRANKAGMCFRFSDMMLATPLSIKDSDRRLAGEPVARGALRRSTQDEQGPRQTSGISRRVAGARWGARTKPECALDSVI